MIKQLKWPAITAVALGTGGMLMALLTAGAAMSTDGQKPEVDGVVACPPSLPTTAAAIGPISPVFQVAANATGSASENGPGVLDQRRQFALGMIETGNHDGEIGGAGEVSRYQIMPSVWRHYSDSQSYRDPGVSLEVAQRYWAALYTGFKGKAHREPTDFDMYVLWNTHYGYYANRNFDPSLLGPKVRNRAQRFVNLVEWGQNS
jgi:hypothetical protein